MSSPAKGWKEGRVWASELFSDAASVGNGVLNEGDQGNKYTWSSGRRDTKIASKAERGRAAARAGRATAEVRRTRRDAIVFNFPSRSHPFLLIHLYVYGLYIPVPIRVCSCCGCHVFDWEFFLSRRSQQNFIN